MKNVLAPIEIQTPWGPLGYITFKRTYARRLDDLSGNTTEEFIDTIRRVIKACRKQLNCGFTETEEAELEEIFLSLKGSVAGRFWWQLGTKTVDKLGLLSLQNCAFTTVDSIRAFAWAMDALMLGSGVGFNIQREYIYQLPKVKKVKIIRDETNDADFIVPDKREGWIKLLELVLKSHFETGESFTFSTVLVRGKGTLIKGFGGVASGPEELCTGIAEINKILNNRAGKKIRPIDALDIMNVIGSIVVAGNVRRSAEIALGDADDLQYLSSKRWDLGNIPNYRAMSNNSVVCNDINVLPEQFWDGYKGNGEPFGLINLSLSRKIGRLGETQYPDPEVAGYNPSLRAGTRIWTKEYGMIPIEELQDKTFTVNGLNGNLCSAKCWQSSPSAFLYKITLRGGAIYYATAEHKWAVLNDTGYSKITTDKLTSGMKFPRLKEQDLISYKTNGSYEDGLLIGYFYGDGWITDRKDNNKRQYGVIVPTKVERKFKYLEKFKELFQGNGYDRNNCVEFNSASVRIDTFFKSFGVDKKEKGIPEFIFREASNKFINGFIQGYFDADGHTSKDNRQSISSKDSKLINDFQDLLGFKGRYYNKTEHKYESYVTKGKTYIKSGIRHTLRRNLSQVGFETDVIVDSIELTNLQEPVWDISVNDTDHAFQLANCITGNCAEQSLAPYETCCLAEMFLPNITSIDELKKVATYLYRINKHSLALDCHLKETEAIVHKNMRMGIGVTGYLQATEEQKSWLSDVYLYLREYDKEYSKKHGFPNSIKLTTVKPSGTLSLLAGVTSGVHPAYSKHYLRRIRIASNSPLANLCVKNGYHSEYQKNFDGTDDKNTVVVSFPCVVPEGTVLAKELTAVEQLEYVKKLQTEWSDNAVSCTVYYKREELDSIKSWLKQNYNDGVKSVSFLLHNEHGFKQAPLEEITEEEFNKYSQLVKPILSGEIKEDDMLDSFECIGGFCPIK